jgi:hypothetical protein
MPTFLPLAVLHQAVAVSYIHSCFALHPLLPSIADIKRLQGLLIPVIQKFVTSLSNQNVVVNVTGGLQVGRVMATKALLAEQAVGSRCLLQQQGQRS